MTDIKVGDKFRIAMRHNGPERIYTVVSLAGGLSTAAWCSYDPPLADGSKEGQVMLSRLKDKINE